jgi:hypothetical protein
MQAEECLKRERDRVSHYLHSSSEIKLVEVSWLHITCTGLLVSSFSVLENMYLLIYHTCFHIYHVLCKYISLF